VLPDTKPVYHLYVVQVPSRDKVRVAMDKDGIETGIHYPIALHEQPAYAYLNHKPEDFPIASEQGPRLLSLPMFAEISDEQIGRVAESLVAALAS
jgi:dTDP-4-amino-4,6-dideoxygalactose transaminase